MSRRHALLVPFFLAACNAILGNQPGRDEPSAPGIAVPEGGGSSSSSSSSGGSSGMASDGATSEASTDDAASCSRICDCSTPSCRRIRVANGEIAHLAASMNRMFVYAGFELRTFTITADDSVTLSEPFILGNVVIQDLAARFEDAQSPLFVVADEDGQRVLRRCVPGLPCTATPLVYADQITLASGPATVAVASNETSGGGGELNSLHVELLDNDGNRGTSQPLPLRASRLTANASAYFASNESELVRFAYTGDALAPAETTTLAIASTLAPTAIAANATSVFLNHVCDAPLCQMPEQIDGGLAIMMQLAIPARSIHHLFADATYLYWSTDQHTMRCNHTTDCIGSVEVLLDQPAVGFTRNESQVFFAAGDDIFALPYNP